MSNRDLSPAEQPRWMRNWHGIKIRKSYFKRNLFVKAGNISTPHNAGAGIELRNREWGGLVKFLVPSRDREKRRGFIYQLFLASYQVLIEVNHERQIYEERSEFIILRGSVTFWPLFGEKNGGLGNIYTLVYYSRTRTRLPNPALRGRIIGR